MSADEPDPDESDVPSADAESIPDSVDAPTESKSVTVARESLREALQYYEAGRPGYAGKFIRRALEELEDSE